jgi:uncharacterized protein YjbI with pentapeptide repeats
MPGMRGIKPFKLGFLTRPFQWGTDHRLGVSTMVYFSFGDPPGLHTDVEMWQTAAEELPGKPLEEGIPRSRAEFLVVGACHQPGGVARPTCPVRVRVGNLEKQVYVIGDRVWNHGVPSPPQPFTSMPLVWERAYGGEGFAKNPVGKGFRPTTQDGRPVHAMPNVEAPGSLIDSPSQRPEPAGLGPIDFTWPQRFSRAGTYDQRWLETRFPGYADDLDWRIWNLASSDQQRDEPWVGDEPVLIENMHPEKPRIETRLPELIARAFVARLGREARLVEVPMQLRAVWLFPHREQGILIFQGAVRVLEDDARDITTLMVAAERLGQPRPFAHYEHVYRQRTGPEGRDNPGVHLRDEDLVPDLAVGYTPGIEADMKLLSPQGHRAKRMQKQQEAMIADARARVAAQGLDPDEHGPLPPEPIPEPPELSELPAFLESVAKRMREEKEKALKSNEEGLQYVRDLYASQGLDPHMVDKELAEPVRGPPKLKAEHIHRKLDEVRAQMEAHSQSVDELAFYQSDEQTRALLAGMEREQLAMYRRSAHFQQPAFRMTPAGAELLRQQLEHAAASRQSLRGRDLTGLAMEDARLTGADLTEALLESAWLPRVDLRGANLTDAVLAHALLEGANLTGAALVRTNLGKAHLVGSDLTGADLSESTMQETRFAGCSLRDTRLINGTCLYSDFSGSDLAGARLDKTRFVECRFEGTRFAGGAYPEVVFFKADLRGADLRGANLDSVTFFDCALEGANLAGATLRTARCFGEAVGSWRGVDLRGADLTKANLRGLDLREAKLDGAKLDEADLSESDLRGASFYRAVARSSLWIRANLEGASLVSIDLKQAILQKADLRSADLRGANLYAADMALVRGDERTNVTDAITLKVRSLPHWSPPRPIEDEEVPA